MRCYGCLVPDGLVGMREAQRIRILIDRQGLRVQSQLHLRTPLPRCPPQAEEPVAAQTQAEGSQLQSPMGA